MIETRTLSVPKSTPATMVIFLLLIMSRLFAMKGTGFSRSGKLNSSQVLYQGTTLVVPQMPQKILGFSPCGKYWSQF
jgi:hypothetical protein